MTGCTQIRVLITDIYCATKSDFLSTGVVLNR